MQTWIVVPTYNEAENIGKMVSALLQLPVRDLAVLIVDDDSPDGTGSVAEELKRRYAPRVDVIHRKGARGLGTAYVAGFKEALARGAQFVGQMDADFSHSPQYLTRFFPMLNDYDVVVGSRYVPGGHTDRQWSRWRYLLSWWANSIYVRMILGLEVRDATAGFKVFRRQVLEAIGLDNVRSNGYIFQVELAYLTEKLGFQVLEWPIYFEDRRIGRSKMSVRVKLEAALRVLQIRMHYGALGVRRARVEFQRESL